MEFNLFETNAGNFWLEADGRIVPCLAENKLEYLNKFEFKSMNDPKVNLGVIIKPIISRMPSTVNKLSLRTDIQKDEWQFDEFTTGEGLLCNNLINNQARVSLSMGISSYDEYPIGNIDDYPNMNEIIYPQYDIDYGCYYAADNGTLAIGYYKMNSKAIDVVEIAIAIKYFNESERVTTDATDISVFYLL